MEIIFLGTGTSMGVPIIGCHCPVCKSNDIRDKRTRPSVLLRKNNFSLLIDAPQELRLQLINENIDNIDAIIITHAHADHVFGLDDTRIFSLKSNKPQKIYCNKNTENELRQVFSYVFSKTQEGGGKPSFVFQDIEITKEIGPFKIESFKVYHGNLLIDAFVIDDKICIIFDASYIDYAIFKKLKNKCEYAIINGLRLKPHNTHFSYCESSFLLKALGIKKGYIVHVSHNKSHVELEKILPEGIHPAYDGLRIKI